MMRRPLTGIGRGLSESTAPTEQPTGSYLRGVNVRGIDARSGRQVWGAQRAGLTQLGDAFTGGHARHYATASQLVSARNWVDLTLTAQDNTEPALVGKDWSVVVGERALAVATGVDGQAYVLGQSGDVAILNTKGVEVERISSESPVGYSPVPRIFTDATGAVYTAASLTVESPEPPGLVYRWTRSEEGIWSQAWQAETEGPIETFVYERGALYIAEGPYETGAESVLPGLSRVGSPLLGSQILWRETRIAYPIVDLAVTRRGQCLASSPSSVDRNAAAAGYGTRQVDWTPFEWPTFSTLCWSWVDAFEVNDEGVGPMDGEDISVMRDRRFEETEFEAIDDESPARALGRFDSDIIQPPVYSADALGGAGGVLFSAGTSLVSRPSLDADDPFQQQTLIPGYLDLDGGTAQPGGDWTACMVVELTEAQSSSTAGLRQILQQKSNASGQPDWIVGTDGAEIRFAEDEGGAAMTGDIATTSRAAVLSLECEDGSLALYINGEQVATDTTTAVTQGGPFDGFAGAFTAMGGLRPNRTNLLSGATIAYYNVAGGAVPSTGLADVERVRDGNTNEPDITLGTVFVTGSGNVNLGLTIDFGSSTAFDSFSFWSSSSSNSASSVVLEFSNDNFSTIDYTQTVSVSPGAGSPGSPVRNDYLFGEIGTNYRYARLRPTLFHSGDEWEVSEIAFYEQEFGGVTESANFNLGEFVCFRQAGGGGTLREILEGYLAHRWGISAELVDEDGVSAHTYVNSPPSSTGSTPQDAAIIASTLASPFPVLAKYATDGTPVAAIAGGGVGLGAKSTTDDRVYAIGDPTPDGLDPGASTYGTLLTRFDDEPRDLNESDTFDSVSRPAQRRAPLALGPGDSVFAGIAVRSGERSLRRFDGDAMTETWSFVDSGSGADAGHVDVVVAGAQIDLDSQGQAEGPEYLYATTEALGEARRINVLGLQETGQSPGRDVERLAVLSNGDVVRNNGSGWEVVEAGALPGELPHSATLFGQTIFADGRGYRSYDHANRNLRNFEEAVKGTLPPRCQLIAAYRSRLILARGDNAFTVYQSAFGEPFNFDTGTEVETISQAVAGTVASQGRVPEPITALMPWRDDYLFIGTTESLFVLSGDLADGGRLDQVDKSQGVAFGYAWCESPSGIYYFSARGGLMRLVPGGGLQVVSGPLQRRLEDIDLETNRVRLTYNWIDKTVHIFVIPNAIGSDVQHFVYEEPLGAWHVDDFGAKYANAITAADSLIGDAPDDRTVILGTGDGRSLVWDQYADDDAGVPIRSEVTVGPLSPGSAGIEVGLRAVYGELASDQGPVEVAGRASNVADVPGPPSPYRRLEPGRGYGAGVNVSAPAVFVEVRGVGRPWAIHGLSVEAHNAGAARRVT